MKNLLIILTIVVAVFFTFFVGEKIVPCHNCQVEGLPSDGVGALELEKVPDKGKIMADKIVKSDEDWRKELTPEQYEVLRAATTERPFSGEYHDCKKEGVYTCGACGTELFSSDAKFDSGTGWPSFSDPKVKKNLKLKEDTSYGMMRTEVLCVKCGSHLGHVFDDGPKKSGKRYCINSLALKLKENKK